MQDRLPLLEMLVCLLGESTMLHPSPEEKSVHFMRSATGAKPTELPITPPPQPQATWGQGAFEVWLPVQWGIQFYEQLYVPSGYWVVGRQKKKTPAHCETAGAMCVNTEGGHSGGSPEHPLNRLSWTHPRLSGRVPKIICGVKVGTSTKICGNYL
jgi:hypothetical protein